MTETDSLSDTSALRFSWNVLDDHRFQIDIKAPVTRVGTLFKLTAAIYALGLDIQQGHVHTRLNDQGQPYSEDSFILQIKPGADNLKSPHVMINEASARLGHLMETVLQSELKVDEFLESHKCEMPQMSTYENEISIEFENDKDNQHTAMVIRTDDRPGLLFIIAGVLATLAINVRQATILTTDKGQAEDHFYLQKSGKPLMTEDIQAIRRSLS